MYGINGVRLTISKCVNRPKRSSTKLVRLVRSNAPLISNQYALRQIAKLFHLSPFLFEVLGRVFQSTRQ